MRLLAFVFISALSLLVPPAAADTLSPRVLPVTTTTVYPGEIVSNGVLIEKAFRSNRVARLPVYDTRQMIVGKVARRTLLPGQPILVNALREPDLVKQGNSYIVTFEDEGLSISATATALQSGTAGDIVALRNVDSGTIIRGIVQADATIRVGVE